MTGAVLVCTDGSTAGHAAVRWAAEHARRCSAPLDLVIAGDEDGDRPVRAGLPAGSCGAPVVDALRTSSAEASTLVIPSTLPDLDEVVAQAYCPVVIVPAVVAAGPGPVMLAAASWTDEKVFEFAFREASQRRARLLAVRVWNNTKVDLGRPLPEGIARWDTAQERERLDLEGALSAWRVVYPDVQVDLLVVQDDPADFLVALSHRAVLAVLGRSARGALLTRLAGSPVAALTVRGHCPVVVVPADGPPQRTLLPSHGSWLSRA